MKRSDIWWAVAYGLLAVFTVLFCVTGGFAKVNIAYPYLAGFAQFAVYATAGELLPDVCWRELGRSTGRLGSKA